MSNKRPTSSAPSPSSSQSAGPPSKRAQPQNGSLSSWILSITPSSKSKPIQLPSPIVSSPPFTDRRSTFVAHAAPLTTQLQANHFQSHLRQLVSSSHPKSADHEMLAYRIMALRPGKDGLKGEDDWTVKMGGEDDEEKGGSRTILNVLEKRGEVDVGVVVSRWYGGIMLGPDRFRHIANVTTQALTALAEAMILPEMLERLSSLDFEIAHLTSTSLSSPSKATSSTPDYSGLNVEKVERLIKAREKRVELLRKKKEEDEHDLQSELEQFVKDQGGGAEDWIDEAALEEEVEGEEEDEDLPPLPDLSSDSSGSEKEEEDEDPEAMNAAREAEE